MEIKHKGVVERQIYIKRGENKCNIWRLSALLSVVHEKMWYFNKFNAYESKIILFEMH